uniref:Uncharacterized protein n=1 Tax=Micrurus corallinus TaxID=54390 RepID=A0A2D4ETJ3_MICCO
MITRAPLRTCSDFSSVFSKQSQKPKTPPLPNTHTLTHSKRLRTCCFRNGRKLSRGHSEEGALLHGRKNRSVRSSVNLEGQMRTEPRYSGCGLEDVSLSLSRLPLWIGVMGNPLGFLFIKGRDVAHMPKEPRRQAH